MNYAQFQAFVSRHVWREGDTSFESEVELFVRLAEGRLNRDLLVEDRSALAYADATTNRITLPTDCAVVRNVEAPDITDRPYRGLSYITPSAMTKLRASTYEEDFSPHFSIQGNNLLLSGPFDVATPVRVEIIYYQNIPSFVDTDASWVEATYFDLYLYAVLAHTATYLREDPRVAIWKDEYNSALSSVLTFNERKKYSDGPLHMPLPGAVA